MGLAWLSLADQTCFQKLVTQSTVVTLKIPNKSAVI
jgi:hypothetical protein